MFEAPIPGQSLTTTPKNSPYERPPEINDPEEALVMYMDKLNDPDMMGDIMELLELDVDVKTIVEGITRMGVARGVHTVDVSLIISPVIHELIVDYADELGIEYDEGLVDREQEEKKSKLVDKARREKALKKAKTLKSDMPSEEDSLEDLDFFEGDDEELEVPEAKSVGLMGRRK